MRTDATVKCEIDMSSIMLQDFPLEVVNHILLFLPISDVIEVLLATDVPIVKYQALSIIRRANLSYNNRIKNYTYLIMYLLTESYIKKNNLDFIYDPEVLVEFANRFGHELHIEITLSYYIFGLAELAELMSVIRRLDKTINIRFNFEVELDPALFGVLDANKMHLYLTEIKFLPLVSCLQLTNYTSIPFRIVANDYPNLCRLWVKTSNLQFSDGYNFKRLQDLDISPNVFGFNPNKALILSELPSSLSKLALGHVRVHESIINRELPNLKLIKLQSVFDCTRGEFTTRLIQQSMFNKKLENLHIESLINIDTRSADLLVEGINRHIECLHSLHIINFESRLPLLATEKSSKRLKHLTLCNSLLVDVFKLDGLTRLNLANNNITDCTAIGFPPNLIELYLSFNPIDWSISLKVKFPRKLKRLELKHTNLRNLAALELPDSIRTLALEVNSILSIDDVKFPRSLTNLGIGANQLTQINRHYLPPSLCIVHFTENFISSPIDLSMNANGEALNLFAVYLNDNRLKSLQGFKFNENLKVLSIADNRMEALQDIDFRDLDLREFSAYGCGIKTIKDVTFNESLESLDFGNNRLRQLPPIKNLIKLETLDLKFNNMSSVPINSFRHLQNLTKLNLGSNNFRTFKARLTSNLKILVLSNNKILALSLQFDEKNLVNNSTKLSSLVLSGNKLTTVSPVDIGHTPPSICHNDLVELDLSSNKMDDVEALEFPDNIKALICGYTGTQDQFGYEIARNVIKDSFCIGKRVEH